MDILEYIQAFNIVSVILRLFLATLLGGLIGLERASKGETAGVRTFALVCTGSALAAIANLYLFEATGNTDTARLPAGVLSGIGFLGVGTIIITGRNYVKGLTTAATLWTTAALGITLGTGYVIGSLLGFFVIIFIVIALSHVSSRLEGKSQYINLYLEVTGKEGIRELLDFLHSGEYEIVTMEKQKKATIEKGDAAVMITVDLKKRTKHMDILAALSNLESVHYVEEIKR